MAIAIPASSREGSMNPDLKSSLAMANTAIVIISQPKHPQHCSHHESPHGNRLFQFPLIDMRRTIGLLRIYHVSVSCKVRSVAIQDRPTQKADRRQMSRTEKHGHDDDRDNDGHHRARPLWFPFVIVPCRAPVDGMVMPRLYRVRLLRCAWCWVRHAIERHNDFHHSTGSPAFGDSVDPRHFV